MTFSIQLHNRCQRRQREKEAGSEVFRGLLEPFVLEDCYPKVWMERGQEGSDDWYEGVNIQPHQAKFHEGISLNGTRAKFCCFSGGVGSGKTWSACAEVYKLCRIYPGIRIVVVCPFDWYFTLFLMPTFWEVCPLENNKHIKSYNIKDRLLRFVNGSQIMFRAFDEAGKIKGWEAHVIWIEEASQLGDGNNEKAREIFLALCMRLRAQRPLYPLRLLLTQNPSGHSWVWTFWIKDEPGKRQPLGDIGQKTVFRYNAQGEEVYYSEWEKTDENGDVFYAIAVPSRANAHLPVGYVNTMLGTMADSPGMRARMVEGLWNPVNTLVYDWPIYSERTHLVDWYDFLAVWEVPYIPPWWPVIVGVDTGGARSPWAVEFYVQVPDESHWICFDEIYLAGATWDEIATLIHKHSNPFPRGEGLGPELTGFESIQYFSDPISSKQAQGPVSEKIKEWFQAAGLHFDQPKHYSKGGGIESVRTWLKPDRTRQSPYHSQDVETVSADGTVLWDMGLCGIYYLTNVPGKNEMMNAQGQHINPMGHAAPGNIAEKRVWRRDNSKQRPTKESEEGLSPFQSEKVIDRDDHAQTAEIFAYLARYPIEVNISRSKQSGLGGRPVIRYGARAKHRRD